MIDIFNDYQWHSAIEPKRGISSRRIIRSLPVKKATLEKFQMASKDGKYLVHKATRALWKFDDDGKIIRPVFQDDFLTEDEQ